MKINSRDSLRSLLVHTLEYLATHDVDLALIESVTLVRIAIATRSACLSGRLLELKSQPVGGTANARMKSGENEK